MKAIHVAEFVDDISSLRATRVSAPTPSAATPIHIRIHHAAINYVDLLYARGKHQNNAAGLVRPPFVLGLEFSGVVMAAPSVDDVESNPDRLQRGDGVFGACSTGAFAEEICVSAAQVRRLPVGVPGWNLRAAAGVAATAPVAYGALVRCARLKAGETILVHAAAGGLGVMAVQIAQALGARVIATVGSEAKANFVCQTLGVPREDIFIYGQRHWEHKVLHGTGGKRTGGVDVVFDTVGLIEASIRCAKYNGRIIVAGFAGREGDLEKVAANRILLKGVSVIGYRYGEQGRRSPGEHETIWTGLESLIERGLVKPTVHGESFTGLDSVTRAMQAMANREICGKAIVDIELTTRQQTKL